MKISRIITSFSRYSDADFDILAQHIVTSLTGNANFPSPNPGMTVVQDAAGRYNAALLAAKDRSKNNVADKNDSRQALEIILSQLGYYIMNVSNGNVNMLTTSGFTITKDPEPRYIENPGNVSLSNGISTGTMVAQVPAVKGGVGYLHQITAEPPTDETVWISTASTASKYTFSNLTPGKQYWVRIAVTGTRQQVAYSTVATQFAQ